MRRRSSGGILASQKSVIEQIATRQMQRIIPADRKISYPRWIFLASDASILPFSVQADESQQT